MTLWRGPNPLILASRSHARQMLLANAGIGFEAVPADIDERIVELILRKNPSKGNNGRPRMVK